MSRTSYDSELFMHIVSCICFSPTSKSYQYGQTEAHEEGDKYKYKLPFVECVQSHLNWSASKRFEVKTFWETFQRRPDSPPAGNRKRRTASAVICLSRGQGYPPGTGVSLQQGPRTSHWGTPRKHMGPVGVLWGRDGVLPRKVMGPQGWK